MRLAVRVLACGGLVACSSPVEPPDARTCPRTGEFANSGCLAITGQVVDPGGQPLAGIVVGTRYLPGREAFTTDYATTDTTGAFALRVSRLDTRPRPAGPDTVSLWVHGADPRTAGLNIPARVQDSVLVRATVSPIGTIPTPTTVRLTLTAD